MDNVKNFIENETFNASLVYKENIDEKLNICLGNVSCDMDSSIGVYILAYYLTNLNKYYNDIGNFDYLYIPVINCPRGELESRLDIAFHFHKYNIDIKKLVYINDIDLNFYASKNLLNLSIIDHNKLDVSQEYFAKSVSMIVDHHVDTKEYDNYTNLNKIVTFCGSACSIAFNLFYDSNIDYLLNKDIAMFFSPAIMLDTENLNPDLKNSKWGDIDEIACHRIFRLISKDVYDSLIKMKTERQLNIDLGLELILKKDYKNYVWRKDHKAGISVVFNTFHELMLNFSVEGIKQQIKKKIVDNNLNMYMIITQTYNSIGKVKREFMFYDTDNSELNKLIEDFKSKCPFKYKSKKFTGLTNNFAFFILEDDSISRKKFEPVLREIFSSI